MSRVNSSNDSISNYTLFNRALTPFLSGSISSMIMGVTVSDTVQNIFSPSRSRLLAPKSLGYLATAVVATSIFTAISSTIMNSHLLTKPETRSEGLTKIGKDVVSSGIAVGVGLGLSLFLNLPSPIALDNRNNHLACGALSMLAGMPFLLW